MNPLTAPSTASQPPERRVARGDPARRRTEKGPSATQLIPESDSLGRLFASKAGVQTTESSTVHRPVMDDELENLGGATAVHRFDGSRRGFALFFA
jgi:hypothetical protein